MPKLPETFEPYIKMWDKAHPGKPYPLGVVMHEGKPIVVWKNRASRRKEYKLSTTRKQRMLLEGETKVSDGNEE